MMSCQAYRLFYNRIKCKKNNPSALLIWSAGCVLFRYNSIMHYLSHFDKNLLFKNSKEQQQLFSSKVKGGTLMKHCFVISKNITLFYLCHNKGSPSRKYSIKAAAKWRNLKGNLLLKRSKWLGPRYKLFDSRRQNEMFVWWKCDFSH